LGLGTLAAFSAGCEHEREREVKVIRTHPGHEVRVEKEREVDRDKHGRVEIKKEREKEIER